MFCNVTLPLRLSLFLPPFCVCVCVCVCVSRSVCVCVAVRRSQALLLPASALSPALSRRLLRVPTLTARPRPLYQPLARVLRAPCTCRRHRRRRPPQGPRGVAACCWSPRPRLPRRQCGSWGGEGQLRRPWGINDACGQARMNTWGRGQLRAALERGRREGGVKRGRGEARVQKEQD